MGDHKRPFGPICTKSLGLEKVSAIAAAKLWRFVEITLSR